MDRRTLFMAQAELLLFFGAVIFANYFAETRSRRERDALFFSLSFLCGGLGLLLQSLQGSIPHAVSVVPANVLLILSIAFLNRSIALTTRQERHYMVPLLLLGGLSVASGAYFTWWHPNLRARVVETVLVHAVMYSACIELLWRNRDQVIQPAVRAMMAYISLQILSGFLYLGAHSLPWIPSELLVCINIVTIAGLALSYLWVGNLRIRSELELTAMTDPLTGLFNRRGLETLGGRDIDRAVRKHQPCSALMLDVDHFKQINDTLGHAAGDNALQALGSVLLRTLRSSDTATRLGGDEFFVLLPDCDETRSNQVVERLQDAIAEMNISPDTEEVVRMQVSIGQITASGLAVTTEDLIRDADAALYQEKERRRHTEATQPSMANERVTLQPKIAG